MGIHMKSAAVGGVVGGLVVAVMFFVLGSSQWFGRTSAAGAFQSGAGLTHEERHQMTDAVHGPGASERMHEAMGPDAEKMMDQCVAMMGTMNDMHSMMGDGMPLGAGRESGEPTQDMMQRMTGQP